MAGVDLDPAALIRGLIYMIVINDDRKVDCEKKMTYQGFRGAVKGGIKPFIEAIDNTLPAMKNIFLLHFKMIIIILLSAAILVGGISLPSLASMQIRSGVLDYRDDIIKIDKGVTVFWEDYEVEADSGEIMREEDIARFFGEVLLRHEDGYVESSELKIYFEEERFVFTENVLMNQQQGEDADETMILRTASLDMQGDTGNFQARGDVEIEQGGRKIAADEGDYEDVDEILLLRNNVKVTEENGDTIESDTAYLHLDDSGIFRAEGNVRINLKT